jgi:hypothetical protein
VGCRNSWRWRSRRAAVSQEVRRAGDASSGLGSFAAVAISSGGCLAGAQEGRRRLYWAGGNSRRWRSRRAAVSQGVSRAGDGLWAGVIRGGRDLVPRRSRRSSRGQESSDSSRSSAGRQQETVTRRIRGSGILPLAGLTGPGDQEESISAMTNSDHGGCAGSGSSAAVLQRFACPTRTDFPVS